MAKGTWIALGVIGAIALVLIGFVGAGVGTYNTLIRESEAVNGQAKQIDVQYQQTFTVVPKLTNLTQQYMKNEREVLENVTALRSGLAPAQNGTFTEKDAYLQDVFRFVALVGNRVEAYPDLKSNTLFQQNMNDIKYYYGKIAVEKTRYNDRVQAYNTYRQECCLPAFLANSFGFGPKEYIGYGDRPNQTNFPPGEPLALPAAGALPGLQ